MTLRARRREEKVGERKKEAAEERGLRRFKGSRTLREREEDAEERPKGGCSKESSRRRREVSNGWLTVSAGECVLGANAAECKKGAKVTLS